MPYQFDFNNISDTLPKTKFYYKAHILLSYYFNQK